MPTGYGELLSSLQGMDEAGPVPQAARPLCLPLAPFRRSPSAHGRLVRASSGPASPIFPMLESIQLSGLLRFVPVPAASPVPGAAHQGLRFPRRHAKGAYSKKIFAPPVKSFSERQAAMQTQEAAAPSAEPPRACTVLVCGFSISRRHRPASRRPRQAACQRG